MTSTIGCRMIGTPTTRQRSQRYDGHVLLNCWRANELTTSKGARIASHATFGPITTRASCLKVVISSVLAVAIGILILDRRRSLQESKNRDSSELFVLL